MDFTFTEEQQAAVEAAKAVFGPVAPDSVPSPALTPGAVADDFDRALWSKVADADLLSLLLAPEHGGAGLDAITLCLVLRNPPRHSPASRSWSTPRPPSPYRPTAATS